MLAMPVATQWPTNVAQALLWVEGLGCSREACSALSCSYCTRAATRCLTALSMCLGVARFASFLYVRSVLRRSYLCTLARRMHVHLYRDCVIEVVLVISGFWHF